MTDQPENQPRKMPASLSFLSYVFFFAGVGALAQCTLLMSWELGMGHTEGSNSFTVALALGLALGFLLVNVSRGLRRRSRGWRGCALLLVWAGFGGIAWEGYKVLAPHFHSPGHHRIGDLSTTSLLLLLVAVLFQLWQLHVLTRMDVCDWFDEKP